ncbi:hypothetical protein ACIQAD_04775 [Streptomyces sp. NPDC088551]|uniref:hypothetical protein n=1 Tax=Streptomyces sp. NPDC088551 TaxID=3365863 RepID=UPI0038286EF6
MRGRWRLRGGARREAALEDAEVRVGRGGLSVRMLVDGVDQSVDVVGHDWMLQDPERGADVLRRFWASLPG